MLNRNAFEFSVNKVFKQVVSYCKNVDRPGQPGTWISDEIVDAYDRLHQMGYAHSAEVWQNGKLVGGLYGVRLGKVFLEKACLAW